MQDEARRSDKPADPPHSGGEDESPGQVDPPEPGEDVKEPPLPGTAAITEKFPRKGDIERGRKDGVSVD